MADQLKKRFDKLLIFQNYFSPSRHAVFEQLGKYCCLTVAYMQSPQDEGRHWAEDRPINYQVIRIPTFRISKLILPIPSYHFPKDIEAVVIVDNNPTNIAMILIARTIISRSSISYVWIEHIPDRSKSYGKTLYQTITSRKLLQLSGSAASFSSMTDEYIRGLKFTGTINRIPQAVSNPNSEFRFRSVESACRFGYLGSDVERKNVASLRAAINDVEQSDISLHLAGGDFTNLTDRETCYGYVAGDELNYFFNQIDVLVLPSIIDPWGLVVNEALLRGRLVIVTKNCGSSELVKKIDKNLVCDVTPESLKNALLYANSLSRSDIKCRIESANVILQDYTIEAAARAFENLLTYVQEN